MNFTYIQPSRAAKILDVSNRTLINWDINGDIQSIRTKGGHRRYLLSDVMSKLQQPSTQRKICYARVSTSSQKNDLNRQIDFFKHRYPQHEIITDIGSGLNFKRKGFNTILDYAINGDIQEVVVTHRDRLCRFGFELVERLIKEKSNGKILVLDKQDTSPEQELVNDLISIITVFSSRVYGLRSNKLKKEIQKSVTEETNNSIQNT